MTQASGCLFCTNEKNVSGIEKVYMFLFNVVYFKLETRNYKSSENKGQRITVPKKKKNKSVKQQRKSRPTRDLG